MPRLAVALATVAAVLLVVPVAEARAGISYTHYYGAIQQPVEQETDWPFPADHTGWVTNPVANCAWDVDDNWQDLAYGTLAGGATLSVDECMVASRDPIWRTAYGTTAWWASSPAHLGVQVTAPTRALVVRSCYSPQGRCFTATPVLEGRGYVYRLCTAVQYHQDDPAVAEIPGSQGGVGLVTTVTVTVTNPTAHAIKPVGSDVSVVGVAQGGGSGCRPGVWPSTLDYPFSWTH